MINILWMILEQIQKMNRKRNETKHSTNEEKKFQNNKIRNILKIGTADYFCIWMMIKIQ